MMYAESPRNCVRMPYATRQVRADGRDGRSCQARAEGARAGRRGGQLRQSRADVAVVRHRPARARAGLEREPGVGPHADGHVEAVVVLGPGPVRSRVGDQVADVSGLVGHDVVQAGNGIAPATGQPRIEGRHQAERRQIARLEEQVVRHRKAVKPAADVGHLHRGARQNLLLHRDAEVPVRRTDAPAVEEGRVEAVRQHARAEARIREHAAQVAASRAKVLGARVRQVAVGHEVGVGVGPGACHARRPEHRRRLRHPERRVRVRIVTRDADALQVLAEARPDRRPPGSEYVEGRAHPGRDVPVAVDAPRLGDDDRRGEEP